MHAHDAGSDGEWTEVEWVDGYGGCKNPACADIPRKTREKHTARNSKVGRHAKCCKGYPGIEGGVGVNGCEPTCKTIVPPKKKFKGADVPLKRWAGTHKAFASNCPADWFAILDKFFTDGFNEGWCTFWCIVKERGSKHRDTHPHWEGSIKASSDHKKVVEKELSDLLDIGKGQGQAKGPSMVKEVYSEGWSEYLAKGFGKPGWENWGNRGMTVDDWKLLNKQYRARTNRLFGFDGRATFKQNLITWYLGELEANNGVCTGWWRLLMAVIWHWCSSFLGAILL